MKNRVLVMVTTLGLVLTASVLTTTYSQHALGGWTAAGGTANGGAPGGQAGSPGHPGSPGHVRYCSDFPCR
jgi:hypothetical protein